MRARRQARALLCASILLVRWRILTDEPHGPELRRQPHGMAAAGALHREARFFATRDELLRLTRSHRIAGDRRRGGRIAQKLNELFARRDGDPAARRLELHAMALAPRQQ